MKIKRSSWHYKVVSDMCAPSMPGSLCSYMAVLLALVLGGWPRQELPGLGHSPGSPLPCLETVVPAAGRGY